MCLFEEEFAKMKEEVPPLVAEAHALNVEAASAGGKIDGSAGLSVSGIADDKSKSWVFRSFGKKTVNSNMLGLDFLKISGCSFLADKDKGPEPMDVHSEEMKSCSLSEGIKGTIESNDKQKDDNKSKVSETVQAAAAAALAAAAVKAKVSQKNYGKYFKIQIMEL